MLNKRVKDNTETEIFQIPLEDRQEIPMMIPQLTIIYPFR